MKYALLNGKIVEPNKNIKKAICPLCGEIVISKCGKIKIFHWAHKSKQNCDPWQENETEWHRNWKNNFPKECQEVIMFDENTGEKHIADVKTKTDIILEFQHSYINTNEQCSREKFYKNVIWIVDANKSYNNFIKNKNDITLKLFSKEKYFYTMYPLLLFPQKWLDSRSYVIFDFGIDDLYCIFPQKVNFKTIGMCMSKHEFIEKIQKQKYEKIFNQENIEQSLNNLNNESLSVNKYMANTSVKQIETELETIEQLNLFKI
ncbi:competence protein [bacterium]|nr:competence protein [bacterium]